MFETFDPIVLARAQFAFTVSFHFIFPAFSIGLASYLAVLNGLSLLTGRHVFLSLFNYWKKIFAVAFGMGVATAPPKSRLPGQRADGAAGGEGKITGGDGGAAGLAAVGVGTAGDSGAAGLAAARGRHHGQRLRAGF